MDKLQSGKKLTRLERLDHWEGVKREAEKHIELTQSGKVAAAIGTDADEIAKYENYDAVLGDIGNLCKRLLSAKDKETAIRRLIEPLIQKDDAWVNDSAESGNDLRIAFFMEYFYQSHPDYENRLTVGVPHLSPQEILEELHDKRFDKAFYADVITKLENVAKSFSVYNANNREFVDDLQQNHRKSTENDTANIARWREAIRKADHNISRLMKQMPDNELQEMMLKEIVAADVTIIPAEPVKLVGYPIQIADWDKIDQSEQRFLLDAAAFCEKYLNAPILQDKFGLEHKTKRRPWRIKMSAKYRQRFNEFYQNDKMRGNLISPLIDTLEAIAAAASFYPKNTDFARLAGLKEMLPDKKKYNESSDEEKKKIVDVLSKAAHEYLDILYGKK
ncbi:hypothetical protein HY968_01450 [Candidatus Kaiserbacteria bacterium]|nr:hypothetical protein [Candidatus Kaiserbacteria bacterium]